MQSTNPWATFDSKPKEPGELNAEDIERLQRFLLSRGALDVNIVEKNLESDWVVPHIPNAIRSCMHEAGYVTRRSRVDVPLVSMGILGMAKSTTTGLQKFLNDNGAEIEVSGLFCTETIAALCIFVETWDME
ncbi:hypothetical protein TrVE_jg12261 [Triparma verrucosa]|uniref:Uncharacterized protein n=1 Tax=Triparma verrucosa TaxID=1606542 RepID=A0A9W7CI87_9STRA|nr:hypothetical protein TrVE_jg12261 [Triparma verrucosa]